MNLDEIERLAAAAHDGPWTAHDFSGDQWVVRAAPDSQSRGRLIAVLTGDRLDANARFIAAAHDAVPELLAEVRRLRDVEATARALVDALPRCDYCSAPATRAYARGGKRYCDKHGTGFEQSQPDADGKIWPAVYVPEYPRAMPIRALQRLLGKETPT